MRSNIASMQAQRRLAQTNDGLRSTFEHLSSGLRIVRASDDAAGLAVASALQVDRRVYSQGVRNLNDALSYLNIADGAIDSLKSVVIRCRELAAQAANGTLSATQRNALDLEAQALSNEYNRILATTTFNGTKVFDASNGPVEVQCGYSTDSINAQTGAGALTSGVARQSTTSAGVQGNGSSDDVSISADGRYLVFQSVATNLVGGDTNGQSDIFYKDTLTGVVTRVNTDSSGAQATGGTSEYGMISADGRYVTFESSATNLVSGDANGQRDIFIKDMQTGITRIVSTTLSGTQGNQDSFRASMSADGRYVAFTSQAWNLTPNDVNAHWDVFVKDMQTGDLRLVSSTSSGALANLASETISGGQSISADGRYVAFSSNATNFIAGDSNGLADIYRKDLWTGEIQRVSTASSGAQGTGGTGNWSAQISADGRCILFDSDSANLVANDTNGNLDVFLKDVQTGRLIRVNTDSSGNQSSGGTYSTYGSISADGRFAVFESDESNLVSDDTNGAADVFVKDVTTGEIRRVSVKANGAQSTGWSTNTAISADGRIIAFIDDLADDMVSGDTNGAYDVMMVNNMTQSYAAGFSSLVRPLTGIYLKNATLAKMAQSTLADYLNELNNSAGYIGTSSSRMFVAVNVLGIRTENIAAAASRITDVDVASESSDLTRRTILQQSAAAVLAQANQQPAIALSLLRS